MIDFKKTEKHLYPSKVDPSILVVKPMRFLAHDGQGDPNVEGGAYHKALEALYQVAYALKMSYKTDYAIPDFEEYVVPPLEGLWWLGEGDTSLVKANLRWTSLLRLPDFIRDEDVTWAIDRVTKKKGTDLSGIRLLNYDEGMAVQCLHLGPYDTEPETLMRMELLALKNGFSIDYTGERTHHEIYLTDPRKTEPDKTKVIIRLPLHRK